ncbi:hypothetical protein CROQUDRAFT_651384 [Cronartium quercuum f. sp. fusiforme G11]|uniref:Cation/H+ exchanger transmembrane domain-containing protein n=1 Tax=Cronartium quercuum f. sp. fusiforme G11 TaxID=708437 RepID=A0A9P6TG77_9BASI|nr:hypothetical protein CROQUDRAFT_651384 [Cronartium quercuum f. sp. fusiforme G11]
MVSIDLDLSDTSKALAVLGFYIVIIGLFTKPLKTKFYLSDSLIATIIGIIVGPISANWISPLDWNSNDEETKNVLTYEFMRISIGIQVFFCGIDLPKFYFKKSWKSLCYLIGPTMTFTWLIVSLIIWSIIPNLKVLDALVIGACIAPTDPVLANAIAKGPYAETNIPERVRNLLAAESGANDGLGAPFIYLAIYLLRGHIGHVSTREAVSDWFVKVIVYQVAFGVCVGIFLGFVARKILRLLNALELIDHESILLYALGLPFLLLGVTGMLGMDDILVCFVAANSFNWDGYYATETHALTGKVPLQDVIDNLLNSTLFIYIATIIPWSDFSNSSLGLSPSKLFLLTIIIIFIKRLPMIAISFKLIPDVQSIKDVFFVGWFGPIGVGAVYYSQVGLREVPVSETHLRSVLVPVVMFSVLVSIFVYAVSVPILYFGSILKNRFLPKKTSLPSRYSSSIAATV